MKFVKMVGTGNDFVVLDLRHHRVRDNLLALARDLCRRAQSVGADGLLTVERSRQADVKMRVINPDGSEADMCGNGARCVAHYAARGRRGRSLTLETKAGLVQAELVTADRVRVTLPMPSPILAVRLTVLGRTLTAYALNTGVPHAVVLAPDLRRVDVQTLGAAIRRHRAFAPAGTNVDFIQPADRHTLRARTYERGVEDETLACGTGAVASALAAASLGRAQSPVTVVPTSGEHLTIRFEPDGRRWREVSLEGMVRVVFEGVLA
ncbi:MAG: diaminopimelate epimerase [Omnitrophica WOR_2 bacterium RIFCSPHIGHO2_02_FULL_68_15]|nr:MAG: diaminopimelate epimerase [Omnitrophica WOR_2 bacterium RIFCSPHIGHO2_02_FULL_68_15]